MLVKSIPGARDIGTVISMRKTLGFEVPSQELGIVDQASIVYEGNTCFNMTMLYQKTPGDISINNDSLKKLSYYLFNVCIYLQY
jgi:hypothetical protein